MIEIPLETDLEVAMMRDEPLVRPAGVEVHDHTMVITGDVEKVRKHLLDEAEVYFQRWSRGTSGRYRRYPRADAEICSRRSLALREIASRLPGGSGGLRGA